MSLSIDLSLCSVSKNYEKQVKYLSLSNKNKHSLTKPLLVDNINTALGVIMFNIDDRMICEGACEYRQKFKNKTASNFDPTLFVNKMLLNSLWHFLNYIPLDYFGYDEYEDVIYYEESVEDKILLNDWFEQFKNLIKQIGDLVEETKIRLKYGNVIKKKTLEENLYFTLSDIQINTIVAKDKYFIGDLKNELTDNIEFEDRNSNFEYSSALNNTEYLEKLNYLLEYIRISDFELVSCSNNNTSYDLIDFYEWWANFENLRNNISGLYNQIKIYNNTLEEFYG
jgi:hypothetical protein